MSDLTPEDKIQQKRVEAFEREHELVFVHDARKGLGFFFWLCVGWIVINIAGAIFASLLPIQDPLNNPFFPQWGGPSAAHWLGTDDQGRDIFARVVFGARVSMVVGFGAAGIGLLIGGSLGMLAALLRGRVDRILQVLMTIGFAVPGLIVALSVLAFWSPTALLKITTVLGFISVPIFFRVIRIATLSVATRDFVVAARVQGARTSRIIIRELLPNIAPIALSYALIGIASLIVLEGSLAFLGSSVSPPTPSWGNMIAEGIGYWPSSTWLICSAAGAMCLFLLALNFVADRLRNYFDVSEVKL